MVFPWTTVDDVLKKFEKNVNDLNDIAANAHEEAEAAERRAAYWAGRKVQLEAVVARAERVARKLSELIS